MAMDALMIGISGMRGTVGGTLTPTVVGNMAMAFSAWLRLHRSKKPINGRFFRLVFGRDSRPSGSWVRDAAAAALVASGVELIDLDIVSTPGVAMMGKDLGAGGGVNGAGCVATATLLSKLGCQLIHINNVPNGLFPHEPEPTAENLVGLAEEVRRQKAQIGFAQDPDADRLAIVDETGRYIGEEYSIALCAQYILSKRPGIACTNLSTSRMLDDIAAAHNSKVIRTAVGEANVVHAMLGHNAT